MDSFVGTAANSIVIVASLQPLLPRVRRFIGGVQDYRESKRRHRQLSDTKVHNWFEDAREFIDACIEACYPPRVVPLPHNVVESGISNQTLMEIWDSLHDDKNCIIGLCGLGGTGKTTLLKTTNNKLVGTKIFEVVFFVTVGSKESFLIEIQKQMMRRLNLKFDENDDEVSRSVSLHNALKGKRYVLFLDSFLQYFPLERVGIQDPEEGNRSKVVLATRSFEVCNRMGTNLVIRVKSLTNSEAWDLFVSKAGEVALMPNIRSVAECVVMECKGLPIAITIVGATLRGETKSALWRNTLRALRESTISEIPGMESIVFGALKLSFNQLDDKIKLHFLYCSLFPKGNIINVNDLCWYWIAESIEDNAFTFSVASDKTHYIIKRIKDACLLESTGILDYVKMHDLVHDMALWTTSSSSSSNTSQHMFRASTAQIEPHKFWKGSKRMSLANNKITRLSLKPDCPDLGTLFLCSNPLISFHKCFFDAMPKLTTLDLSETKIESLPVSIGSLSNLRALNLRCCYDLKDIQHLVKLQSLIFLDLAGCRVSSFPPGMENLSLLRYLDLSIMQETFTIPCKVISAFLKMEVLRLYDTRINWVRQGKEDTFITAVDEVASLKCLQSLDIEIQCIDLVRESFFHNLLLTLECFRIKIGLKHADTSKLPLIRRKELHVGEWGSCFNGLKAMATHAESVHLVRNEVKNASEIVGDSKSLRGIRIFDCTRIESVIQWREIECDDALQNLEIMSLDSLQRLKTVFEGEPPKKMIKLREIRIAKCDNLKFLFTLEMAKHIDQLEHLIVYSCNQLELLIARNNLSPQYYALPKLRTLKLGHLPNLTALELHCLQYLTNLIKLVLIDLRNLKDRELQCLQYLPNLKFLQLTDLPNLTDLVLNSLPNLTNLVLEDLPNLTDVGVYTMRAKGLRLLSLQSLPKLENIFKGDASEKLETLYVSKCDNLKNIFSSESLVEHLIVIKCKRLEDIVAGDELQHIRLPKLSHLELFELPKLRSIIKFAALALPSIESFYENECPNLIHPVCPKVAEVLKK